MSQADLKNMRTSVVHERPHICTKDHLSLFALLYSRFIVLSTKSLNKNFHMRNITKNSTTKALHIDGSYVNCQFYVFGYEVLERLCNN